MKAIRTREEGLDELKRRRKSVAGKADGAERKLNRMSPEHKNLAVQTDTLHKLRDEIRQLDTEIMIEEAKLSDFKRSSARSFMGLKFGGLQELSARGTIVGDFGKQIIAVRSYVNLGMSSTDSLALQREYPKMASFDMSKWCGWT